MPGARRSCAPTPGPHGAMGNSTRMRASAATVGTLATVPCGRSRWRPAAVRGGGRRPATTAAGGRPRSHRGMIGVVRGLDRKDQHGL